MPQSARDWRRGFPTCALLTLLALLLAAPADAEILDVPVTSRAFSQFLPGSDRRDFGGLEFLGGISATSRTGLLGSISSIRFREDGAHFVAVLDTGHWLTGRIERDAQGRLSGLADVKTRSMIDRDGKDGKSKGRMDAEGLALSKGEVLVAFEVLHRIEAYPDPGFMETRPVRRLKVPIDRHELRSNKGMETLAISPGSGPLGAVPVAVTERSLDMSGNIFAAVLEGRRKGVFTVRRTPPWDITDGAFLPDGDLLLLERRFRLSDGMGMRIRRIPGETIRPGAIVDGEVLVDADLRHQIDNMEGLDVLVMAEDDIRVIVVSDDNHSILQRNLILEFRLK